jgi:hypothetical protein
MDAFQKIVVRFIEISARHFSLSASLCSSDFAALARDAAVPPPSAEDAWVLVKSRRGGTERSMLPNEIAAMGNHWRTLAQADYAWVRMGEIKFSMPNGETIVERIGG